MCWNHQTNTLDFMKEGERSLQQKQTLEIIISANQQLFLYYIIWVNPVNGEHSGEEINWVIKNIQAATQPESESPCLQTTEA